mgnify:CR=1 FL=1
MWQVQSVILVPQKTFFQEFVSLIRIHFPILCGLHLFIIVCRHTDFLLIEHY